MFPSLIILASIYLFCAITFRFFIANAPEAFEDEAGFHYVDSGGEDEIFAAGEPLSHA